MTPSRDDHAFRRPASSASGRGLRRLRSNTPREADLAASAAFKRYKSARFFGSLDGLRALSILGVIWFHTMEFPRDTLLGQGNRGVTLFFAISGFLIVTLILRAKQSRAGFRLGQFWGRRALRILPLYYAVLLAYIGLVAVFERDAGARGAFWGNLPAFATFTSNWFVNLDDARVIFYFAWSLAAEEQFYLAWPLLERWLRGWAPLVAMAALLLATQALGWTLGASARDTTWLRIATSVPPALLLGVGLAHLLHRPKTFRVVWRVAGRRGSAVAAFVVAGSALAFAPAAGAPGDLIVALALAGIVASCVVREDNDLARVLRWRPLAWVGTVSYGMYLLHMIAVNIVRRAAGATVGASPWLDFLGGSLVAVGLATLSYVTFERFFLRLKDRWFGTSRPEPAAGDSPLAAPAKAVVKPLVA